MVAPAASYMVPLWPLSGKTGGMKSLRPNGAIRSPQGSSGTLSSRQKCKDAGL